MFICLFNTDLNFVLISVAWGEFRDELNATGWMKLYVHTSPSKPPLQAMHGAGYLEGFLTQQRITEYNHNMWSGVNVCDLSLLFILIVVLCYDLIHLNIFSKYTPNDLNDFFTQQWQWMMANIRKYAQEDPYWQHVHFFNFGKRRLVSLSLTHPHPLQVQYQVEQLVGMTEGYNAASPKNNMSVIDMYMLASWYDLDDIIAKLKPETRPNWETMSVEEISNYLSAKLRCSSLVKVTGDLSELFAGFILSSPTKKIRY